MCLLKSLELMIREWFIQRHRNGCYICRSLDEAVITWKRLHLRVLTVFPLVPVLKPTTLLQSEIISAAPSAHFVFLMVYPWTFS